MERLQDALHRAREKRGVSGGATARRDILGRRQQDTGAAWAALNPYEPNLKELQRNRIVSYFGRQPATPFDVMRTKMVQQAKSKGWRRIAITSPGPGCGKTTITANLAFSLSRQLDLRIIVMELDLRRPALSKALGLREPLYFAKALAGQEPAENHMVCFAENLAFALNSAPAANPSELLQSATAGAVLERLEEVYQPDLVIFDTAPLLVSDDTSALLEHMDAALLVAAAEQTTIEEIDKAESDMAEVTEVMGVVLNKCRYSAPGYGYDYGYGYGDA